MVSSEVSLSVKTVLISSLVAQIIESIITDSMIAQMVTLILNSLLPISSPAKLFLPVLIIISPKEDSLLLVKSFKSGLMKDLYLSKLMIGVLIPSSRLNLTLLNLILLVVLALIEVSLCMILEVKLLLKKMHLRISQ